MHTRLCALVIVALIVATAARADSGECCGDCNSDTVVRVNELITGVNNALAGCSIVPTAVDTPTSTPHPPTSTPYAWTPTLIVPTPLPDQCAEGVPGTSLTVLGTDYIVVEQEVVLENAPETYLLRSPIALNAAGRLTNISNPIYLDQVCYGPPYVCGASGDRPGTICDFPAVFGASSYSSASYTETSGTPTWTFSLYPRVSLAIVIDASHAPIHLFFSGRQSASSTVADFSEFGYSFAAANYPAPPADEIAKLQAELASLLTHISVRRASLPIPPTFLPTPTFAPTPTAGPCQPAGAACRWNCFDRAGCCPPLVCAFNKGPCVTPTPSPPGPPETPTLPCPG